MVDDADGTCEVWQESHRKARKQHQCQECGRTIKPGERYMFIFTVFEGEARGNKVCAHCEIACDWLRSNCGGYMLHAVEEDIDQHVEEYRRMDIARLAVGMRRNWQRIRKAGLMPVPKLPRPLELGDHR